MSTISRNRNIGLNGNLTSSPLLTPALLLLLIFLLFELNSRTSNNNKNSNLTKINNSPITNKNNILNSNSELIPIIEQEPNDLVIIYVYFETSESRVNTEFFVKHALHNNADFIFVMNGETDINILLPKEAPNVRVIKRGNDCYDLGTFGEVLQADDRAIVKKYKRFILMNASIRGPFVPHWSTECWSDAYMSRVTEKVKLVGMTFNCQPTRHVQSMIWATDKVGIEVLLNPRCLGTCHHNRDSAVNAETSTTGLMLESGYEVDVMLAAFQADPTYSRTCIPPDILYQGAYYGTSLSAFETMFSKPSAFRAIEPLVMERLTQWTDEAKFSSVEACANSARVLANRKAAQAESR